jgi:hypothetical protein
MREIRLSGSMSGKWNRQPIGRRATSRLYVRREKTLSSSGWESRPAIGSLQPEAIEAAVEATKLSKPSMERIVKRFREHAGRNVSER